MSAPCRSSKARLPAAVDPMRPDARRKFGRPSWDASSPTPPLTQTPRGCLKGSWSKSLGGRLTTLTPANVFETPERPLANGRDRPALINRAPRCGGASLLDLDLGPSLFQSRLD